MLKKIITVGACWLVAGMITISAENFLVENSKINYSSVLPENPIPAEKFAAGELSLLLGKVAGNPMPEKSPYKIKLIHSPALDREEFSINIEQKNIVISGGRPRGILYGVYEFLERFAGVRFYSIEGAYTPQQSNIKLPEKFEFKYKSPFQRRAMYVFMNNQPLPDYYLHTVRSRTGINLPQYGFTETFGSPSAAHTYHIYSKDFPEEISWMNPQGKRVQVKHAHSGNICYTNSEVRRRIAGKLLEFIKSDREKCQKTNAPFPTVYNLSQNDANALCFCEPCKTFAAKHNVSGLVIDFTNSVADTVKKQYPDVKIMCFAYKDAVTPPKHGIRVADNVIVQIAHMDWEFMPLSAPRDVLRDLYAPQNREYLKLLEDWNKIAKNLAVWDYWKLYYDKYPSIKSAVLSRAGYIKKYRDLGVSHLFIEAEVDNTGALESFLDLRNYITAKLMYDPDVDVQLLIDDFMQGFYGAAAPFMKEYFYYAEQKLANTSGYLGSRQPHQRGYLDEEFFTRSGKLLAAAENAVANSPEHSRRVAQERLIWDYAAINIMPEQFKNSNTCNRIRTNLTSYIKKYNSKRYCQQNLNDLVNTATAKLNPPSPPEQFKNQEIIDINWTDFRINKVSDDPEAAGGKCIAFSNPKVNYPFAGKYPPHSRNVIFGIYDSANKRYVLKKEISKQQMPQDEKYHFHYVGRAKIPAGATLYTHTSWLVSHSLKGVYDVNFPDDVYDVYVSLKVQGPSYVPGSKQPDDFRMDRIILVRKTLRAKK